MHATIELARRIDRAEIDFCARTTTMGAPDAATVERGGGKAVYGVPGSPVNKVLGLGLGTEVTDEDIDAIEDFYAERGCPVQIELCPLAAADLPSRLIKRGFVLQAFENELARAGPDTPLPVSLSADVTVVAGADVDVWLRVVSEGFASPDRPLPRASSLPSDTATAIEGSLRQLLHPDVVRYLAYVDGHPAAGGLSFVTGGVLGIFATATHPAFRRRGLQSALVAHAMNDAQGRAELVIATTEPGSPSQRTFERLGFQVMYTRAILVKY